ncbi:MAG: hypothetical protein ACOC6H_01415 [Thermoproteota archaeon]
MNKSEESEDRDRTDAMEKRKQMMDRRKRMMKKMTNNRPGALSDLMSQMMSQRGMGNQRTQRALIQKMKEIDQQLDRIEKKLDNLYT